MNSRLTARLTDGLDFPYLLLLVSGGHCQFLTVTGPGSYSLMGGTVDDAVGEALRLIDAWPSIGRPARSAVESAMVDLQAGSTGRSLSPAFPSFL